MNIQDLQGKLVAVLGYGVEGKAVTAYLMKHGITPVLFDQKSWQDWSEEDQNTIKSLGVNFIFGPDYLKELVEFDVAFRSPGVRLIDIPKSDKLVVTSQVKWFFEHCPAKIIGVTGTKGKGTTCSLIYNILSLSLRGRAMDHQSGRSNLNQEEIASPQQDNSDDGARDDNTKVYLTGNIGKDQPLDILNDLTPNDWIVYELSSFQLQDLTQSPHIGVVLMVTEEHLDYHKDSEEYVNAKSAIVKFQSQNDFAIINKDFRNSVKIGSQGKGKKIYFSIKDTDSDVYVDGTQIYGENSESHVLEPIINNTDKIQLRGRHNLENICGAIAVATTLKINSLIISKTVQNFKGLEHRLEFVADKNGVKYYNDSFSTTPETAIAAINSFSEPLIVILGGSSKNSNFSELGQTIRNRKNIRAAILIGQEAGRIKKAMGEGDFKILEGAQNMTEIFEQIKSQANHGDVVLLSPACASFGMFKNYKDRGEQFKKAVMSL